MKRMAILNGSTIQNVAIWDGAQTWAPSSLAGDITGRIHVGRGQTYVAHPNQNTNRTYNIVIDGNSIAAAHLGANAMNDAVIAAGLTINDYYNVAISGQTTGGLITAADSKVDAFYDASFGSKNIVMLWECTNDLYLNGLTAAAEFSKLQSYCQGRKAAGFKVLLADCLPRIGTGNDADFETRRSALNSLLYTAFHTDHVTWIDALVEVGNSPLIGPVSAASDQTYFYDGVHPSITGHETCKPYFTAALQSLF